MFSNTRYARLLLPGLVIAALAAAPASAAFLVEIDIDGLDDGVLIYNSNFAFGGDTTTASQSAAASAVGLTGGDSIFGGDGTTEPDTYRYFYTPGDDVDNLFPAAGTALNNDGDVASGLIGGDAGMYAVYATWPLTSNVSGGLTTFALSDDGGELFSVDIDQNTVQDQEGDGAGNEWIYLGTGLLDPGTRYTLTQQAGSNTFVSMRASGVMFERVPEPTSALLVLLGAMALLRGGRRG